jgi:hypothetical protein
LFVEGIEFEAGLSHQEGIFQAIGLEKEIHVMYNSFRAPGAERERLEAGEVGFFEEALELRVALRPILRRALATKSPKVNSSDSATQFREGFLGVDVVDEFAVTSEAIEIIAHIRLLNPTGDLLY